jgi:cysteine desulfurase
VERIYLDHNATTPLDPRVFETMSAHLRGTTGNASSLHHFGQRARAAVEEARGDVASLIGASAAEVVFTSGGTEADNMAVRGLAAAAPSSRRRIVAAALEHHAVLHTVGALAEEGWDVQLVPAGEDGVVDLARLGAYVDDRTAFVALMLANNETGVLQPVKEAVRIAREHGALVHCDGVQAAGKVPVDVRDLDVDTFALSAHKIYGPQGVGALYVKRGTRMKAFLRGGGQERNRRAGTENVAGIAGLGHAARVAREEGPSEAARVAPLRDLLERSLLALPGCRPNGTGPRVANTASVSFERADAESLVMALDLLGVAVSTGAACAAGAVEPSHVLRAMGLSPARVRGSVRFSLGRGTQEPDVVRAGGAVAEALERQRRSRLGMPATSRA